MFEGEQILIELNVCSLLNTHTPTKHCYIGALNRAGYVSVVQNKNAKNTNMFITPISLCIANH